MGRAETYTSRVVDARADRAHRRILATGLTSPVTFSRTVAFPAGRARDALLNVLAPSGHNPGWKAADSLLSSVGSPATEPLGARSPPPSEITTGHAMPRSHGLHRAVSAVRERHCWTPGPPGSHRWQKASSRVQRLSIAAFRSSQGGIEPYPSKNAGSDLTASRWCIRTIHSHHAMSSMAGPIPENSQSSSAVAAIVAGSSKMLFGPKSP